jgi:5'-3' exonuclease
VGDSADGYPGIPRWGEKAAAAVLARYGRIEDIPDDPRRWDVAVRGAAGLAESLRQRRHEAALYRVLATLRTDAPLPESLEDLRWKGPGPDLPALLKDLGQPDLPASVRRGS